MIVNAIYYSADFGVVIFMPLAQWTTNIKLDNSDNTMNNQSRRSEQCGLVRYKFTFDCHGSISFAMPLCKYICIFFLLN